MTTARVRRKLLSKGQALTEFALVFPLAILLILAVFDVGRAVFVYNGLTNAAREGARLAIVNQYEPMIAKRVNDMAFGSGISNAADPDFVKFYKQDPNLDPTLNDECTTLATGCIAVVTAETDWSAITPIIGSIIGPINFTARSELPIELVCPNSRYPEYDDPTGQECPRMESP